MLAIIYNLWDWVKLTLATFSAHDSKCKGDIITTILIGQLLNTIPLFQYILFSIKDSIVSQASGSLYHMV